MPLQAKQSNCPKILFVVTEDWYFWSHRLSLARAARDSGLNVLIATRINNHGERIRQEGFTVYPLKLRRESRNPLREFAAVAELIQVCRREAPDLVHLVALKPIIYGSIAARFLRDVGVVNAIAGMGYLGTSSSLQASLLRPIVKVAFRWLFHSPRARVIVQNPEDAEFLRSGILRDETQLALIRGSGVDLNVFESCQEPSCTPTVVLPCRMLINKGVFEFVEAARILKSRGFDSRFLLVGGVDVRSPAAIPESQLLKWHASGVVEWLGHCTDMPSLFRSSNIICLPSYREGVPKVLIEAAAAARAIVTTDVPGCREVVRHGVNGLLIPPRDSMALAETLQLLLRNPELRARMGKNGREIAAREFSEQRVIQQTLSIYHELLLRQCYSNSLHS